MAVAAAVRRVSSLQLLRTLIERQLRLRAKRTFLGVIWPIVSPLFLLVLYAFVFNRVFRVPVRDYHIYLFAALLPWSLLAQTLGQAVTSVSSDAELVRRSRFRYELLPVSVAGVFSLYFLVTLTGFVVFLALRGSLSYATLPAIVLPVADLVVFVAGVSMVLALIDVYNRDLRALLSNLLTIWFFLVPIVYRPSMASGWLRKLRSIDPMNMIVAQFRDVLYFGHLSRPRNLVLMTFICSVFFAGCLTVFRRFSADLPKDV